MTSTYMTCPECGKRALSVATRCPQCGVEFAARPVQQRSSPSDFGRVLPLLVVAGVVVATVALATAVWRRTADRDEVLVAALPPELDSAMAAASPPAATGERRFARTWTNVRSRRSATGDLAGVLLPGDTVVADSLRGGWWRVTFEGKVMGYAYQSSLVEAPLALRP
ncbi:MAG: SH3 domain-containing protein [Gemmatimonadales bacterium]